MSLPAGCAKADNGFLFIRRLRGELAGWSEMDLRDRLYRVCAHMTADGAGLAFTRSYVRTIAVAERRALEAELTKRARPR